MREAKGIAGLTALALAIGMDAARAQSDLDFPPLTAPAPARAAEPRASAPRNVDPPVPPGGRVPARQPITTVKTTAPRRAICPEGPPAEILKYMNESLQVVADETKPEEVRRAFQEAFDDILAAADKLITHRSAQAAEVKEAKQFQASVLYQGAGQNLPGYRDKLERLAAELYRNEPKSEVAALAAFLSVRAGFEADGALAANSLDRVRTDYMKRFPRDEAAIDLIGDIATAAEQAGDYARARDAYKLVETNFPRSEMAARLPKVYDRLELVGKRMSLRGVALANGATIDLNARSRGKVAIVHYWTMWSKPCMPELETLRELRAGKLGQDLEIIGVPLDRDVGKLREFLQEYQIDWTQVDPTRAAETADAASHTWFARYAVTAVPMTFVLDKEGKVAATNVRGAELERVVDDLIHDRRVSFPASRTATRRPTDEFNLNVR